MELFLRLVGYSLIFILAKTCLFGVEQFTESAQSSIERWIDVFMTFAAVRLVKKIMNFLVDYSKYEPLRREAPKFEQKRLEVIE